MNRKLWNIFHDGSIISAHGSIPGNIDFVVELECLREKFADLGVGFRIHIAGCDLLTFKSFTTNQTCSGLAALSGQDLEILTANFDGDVLQVVTVNGILRIRYISDAVFLDSGRTLEYADLAAAASRALAEFRDENHEKRGQPGESGVDQPNE